ncbi:MAG: hypothetical protein CM1200mP26_17390 [Acidimicrobiales bacterium]|nr:MAG: hypothetical protein CM1200mP26_17390 [Acidimicrobiales bacterium]
MPPSTTWPTTPATSPHDQLTKGGKVGGPGERAQHGGDDGYGDQPGDEPIAELDPPMDLGFGD